MNFLLKTFGRSLVQDAVTAVAGAAVLHGYIPKTQEEGLIGSLFFIAMAALHWYERHQAATQEQKK